MRTAVEVGLYEQLALCVEDAEQTQDREIRRMNNGGDYNIAEIADLFSVSRSTVYRALQRTTALPPLPADTRPAPDIAKYDQLLTRTPRTETREP